MSPQDRRADEDPTNSGERRRLHAAIAGTGALTLLLVPGSAAADYGVHPDSLRADRSATAAEGTTPLPSPPQVVAPAIDAPERAAPAAGTATSADRTLDVRPSGVAPTPPPSAAAPASTTPSAPAPTHSDGLAGVVDSVLETVSGEAGQTTRDHIVGRGDTWRALARNALPPGASPVDVQAKADRIRVDNGGAREPAYGQVVKIVPADAEDPRVRDRPPEGTVVGGHAVGAPPVLREVRPGETLTAIARSNLAPDATRDQLHSEVARLMSLNALRAGGDLISPGEVLLVEPPGPDRPVTTPSSRSDTVTRLPALPRALPEGSLPVSDEPGTSKNDRRIVGPGGKTYPVVIPDAIPTPPRYSDPADPRSSYNATWPITPDEASNTVLTGGHDPGWVADGQPEIGLTTVNDPEVADYVAAAAAPIDLSAWGEPAGSGPYRDLLEQLVLQSAEPTSEPLSSGLPPGNGFLGEPAKDRVRSARENQPHGTAVPRLLPPSFDRQERTDAKVGALRAVSQALEGAGHIKDNARTVYHATYLRNEIHGSTRAIVRMYKITTPPSGGKPVTFSYYGQPQADGRWTLKPVELLPRPTTGLEFRSK